MIRKKQGEIEWLEFEQLQEFPHLVHGVFLRYGGLNFSFEQNKIEFSRSQVLNILGLQNLASAFQVHKDHVETVTSKMKRVDDCDALVTCQKELGLLIKHADCQATIVYDPIANVIANVHCGWRGSVCNIYQKVISHLQEKHGCKPENLLVCISPSLGPEKAEFVHYKTELPSHFYPFQIAPNYFDFWEISKMQLQKGGVLGHHIEIAKMCTYLGKDDFFSYRREKKLGSHATVVALKQLKPVSES